MPHGARLTDLRTLLAERLRRDQLGDAIHRAVAERFELLRVPSWARAGGGVGAVAAVPRIRRRLVYADVAETLEVTVMTNAFCLRVQDVCVDLGAVPARPHNQHVFLGMRPRLRNPRPAAKLSQRERERLQREWREKLAADGFEDIEKPQGALKRLPDFDPTRAELNEGYLSRAREAYWRDLRVWHEHAVAGKPVDAIADEMGLGRSTVHDIIQRLRRAFPAMAGHPGQGEEISADADPSRDDGEDR